MTRFELKKIRADFPILDQKINQRRLVYLDSAATAQKPKAVIDRMSRFYSNENANVHRGLHELSEKATRAYERARKTVARFLNARPEEIIFLNNTTEAINLLAYSLKRLRTPKRILLSIMEHHSNIVPWQTDKAIAFPAVELDFIPLTKDFELNQRAYRALLLKKPAIIALTGASNVLGTVPPLKEMIELARKLMPGAIIIIDAAQLAPHRKIDVAALDCDALALSGHKLYGPMGIGVLYVKQALLEQLPAFLRGGETIKEVSLEKTIFAEPPARFEAGTPNVAGALGLEAAINYLEKIGWRAIEKHEKALLDYGLERLSRIKGLKLFGPRQAKDRLAIFSFDLQAIHPHDIAQILNDQAVAVRSGHGCAQPLMNELKVPAVTRASLGFYNSRAEIDRLAGALERVIKIFQPGIRKQKIRAWAKPSKRGRLSVR